MLPVTAEEAFTNLREYDNVMVTSSASFFGLRLDVNLRKFGLKRLSGRRHLHSLTKYAIELNYGKRVCSTFFL